ncbi:elongation factor Tu GTP binding domain-containing protein [Besnoitia besnoiti]|uniref:Elongation factor Tu GTP binding domain-containing protein n=1 Tax=Besnoitia besnoiti TaxID=94643 RepID=A0A2A9MHW2_BESBE|nr:elongation factor Tu GTP binding domain-containing protein [Besnoitia besnoiti]PFH34982.1 elongation factor Tu GTP binding domain-containing protein [Besnoitia besnoiti]
MHLGRPCLVAVALEILTLKNAPTVYFLFEGGLRAEGTRCVRASVFGGFLSSINAPQAPGASRRPAAELRDTPSPLHEKKEAGPRHREKEGRRRMAVSARLRVGFLQASSLSALPMPRRPLPAPPSARSARWALSPPFFASSRSARASSSGNAFYAPVQPSAAPGSSSRPPSPASTGRPPSPPHVSLASLFSLSAPRLAVRRLKPVGRKRMKETLLVGRKQKTKTVLLPPYVAPRELRVFFRVDYATCMRACGVRTPEPHRYLWRDESGDRQFECVNKSKVLVPFAAAAHACKLFQLHPVLVDPEPDWPSSFSFPAAPEAAASSAASSEAERTPVVVLLGHINHGKTTLLDRLSGTLVAPFEAGGITQNLTAVTVKVPGAGEHALAGGGTPPSVPAEPADGWRRLTFIDTPGHATFGAMRGRASACADLACVVVDLVEGRRVQTEEVLRLADEFDLPLVVAINKIDRFRAGADGAGLEASDEVKLLKLELRARCRKLREQGFLKRDFDREIVDAVCVSALYGDGIPDLVQRLLDVTRSFPVGPATRAPPPPSPGLPAASAASPSALRTLSSLSLSPGAAALHAKHKRRSDCLVEAEVPPSAIGIILEIGKSSDRGVLYTVLVKHGYFAVGSYFVAGSAYGRIRSINVVSSTYSPPSLGSPVAPPSSPAPSFYPPGTVVTCGVSKAFGEGDCGVDDRIYILPQFRAFRLAEYRRSLERLARMQISGEPMEIKQWEADHPTAQARLGTSRTGPKRQEPGGGQREDEPEGVLVRREVTRGRRAIEEFGVEGALGSKREGADWERTPTGEEESEAGNGGYLFRRVSVEEFHRPLGRQRGRGRAAAAARGSGAETGRGSVSPKAAQAVEGGASPDDWEVEVREGRRERAKRLAASLSEERLNDDAASNDQPRLLDEWALLKASPSHAAATDDEANNAAKRRTQDYDSIAMSTDPSPPLYIQTRGSESRPVPPRWGEDEPAPLEGSGASHAFGGDLLSPQGGEGARSGKAPEGTRGRKSAWRGRAAREQQGAEEEDAEEGANLHEFWGGHFERREDWYEAVKEKNEALMDRWRSRAKHRALEKRDQQRKERAMLVEAERVRRHAMKEPPLTDEEIREIMGEDEKFHDEGRFVDETETPGLPAKPKLRTKPSLIVPAKNAPVIPVILRTDVVGTFDVLLDEMEKIQAEFGMRIPVVHGGIGPVIPRDVVHAEVEKTYGYCPIYAFKVPVLPDAIKQALVTSIVIKRFDVFTDLLADIRERCANTQRLVDHNIYVRSLKTEPTKSGL